MAALLRCEQISVRFPGGRRAPPVTALDGVDLEADEGELVALLGPSGSGKSTLLRVVAGLQAPTSGKVVLGGADITRTPPHRRGVGLMFQDDALFPHRDVGANVAFGLRMQRMAGSDRRQRVGELLDLVGLPDAAGRDVATLSGGEQQRVALARALAPRPRLLLLDEPLASLDRTLRDRLVTEVRGLLRDLSITTVSVTHDQDEAFAFADRIVVIDAGRVLQTGTPEEVWAQPASALVARFLGFANIVAAVAVAGGFDTPWGVLPAPYGARPARTVLVRPDGVRMSPTGALRAVVRTRTFRGDHVLLGLEVDGGADLEASCSLAEAPAPGDDVGVDVDPAAVVALAE